MARVPADRDAWNADSSAEELEDPAELIGRLLLRRIYRRLKVLPPAQRVTVLLSSNLPKLKTVAAALGTYGECAISLPISLACTCKRASDIIDIVDQRGWSINCVVPLADCTISIAEILNSRAQSPTNDPGTSMLRRDKFRQQEALRAAGLAAIDQCVTADVEEAVRFASKYSFVVVKPRDASGGEGVWLCGSPSDVRAAFASTLGNAHNEHGVISELIVMEALLGEEWVVNTVSLHGRHVATDIWRGPSKMRYEFGEPAACIYDVQSLCGAGEAAEVADFTFAALDALGFRNGAAHTEVVCVGRPHLLEVNPRCSGGLPRVPGGLTQPEVLAMSLHRAEAFRALPAVLPRTGGAAAAVFLRSPCQGWISGRALAELAGLACFRRFDRELCELRDLRPLRVPRTVSSATSVGCVVLQGEPGAVAQDVAAVRRIEGHAYSAGFPHEAPPEADRASQGP